jgi:hypothetical protein
MSLTVHQAMQQRERLDDMVIRTEVESDLLLIQGDDVTADKVLALHMRVIITCMKLCTSYDLKPPAYTYARFLELTASGL